MTVLKLALEIWNGEIKGYAGVPDERELREATLTAYMKNLIQSSINKVLHRWSSDSGTAQPNKEFDSNSIAIKVTIEFCITIH